MADGMQLVRARVRIQDQGIHPLRCPGMRRSPSPETAIHQQVGLLVPLLLAALLLMLIFILLYEQSQD